MHTRHISYAMVHYSRADVCVCVCGCGCGCVCGCVCVCEERSGVAYVFYLWQKKTFKVRNQTIQKLSKLQCTSQFCTPSECSVQLSTFLQLESFSFLLMLRSAPPGSMFNSWHVDPTISPQWTIGLIISRLYNLIISVGPPADSIHGLNWKTYGPPI